MGLLLGLSAWEKGSDLTLTQCLGVIFAEQPIHLADDFQAGLAGHCQPEMTPMIVRISDDSSQMRSHLIKQKLHQFRLANLRICSARLILLALSMAASES